MKVLLYTVFKELAGDLFALKRGERRRSERVHSLKAEQCNVTQYTSSLRPYDRDDR